MIGHLSGRVDPTGKAKPHSDVRFWGQYGCPLRRADDILEFSAQRPEVSSATAPNEAGLAAAIVAGAPEVSAAELAEVGEEEAARRVKRRRLAKKLAEEAYEQEAEAEHEAAAKAAEAEAAGKEGPG